MSTNPTSPRRKVERTELGEQHTRKGHYNYVDPHLHLNQTATMVGDEGPVDLHGPAACETTIVYRILARIDGGEWRHDLVGETGAAATYASRSELQGHLSWLRKEAEKHREPKLEYTSVPLFVSARRV